MNDMKKSDTGVVPLSEANKGTEVSAESREGRTVTKRNMRGQSTHQTQSWESVSQATERIRKVAEGKPKEKLTRRYCTM